MLAFIGDHFLYLVVVGGALFMAGLGYASIAEALDDWKGKRGNTPPRPHAAADKA